MIQRIRNWFKRDRDATNLYHPDFKDQIEPAANDKGEQLTISGIKYYRFGKDTNIRWGRYMYLQTFLKEQELRISTELLSKYMENLTKVLNGNKGVIELGKAFQIIGQIQSRCALAFEVDTTYRLASVLFFDDKEDIYTYDKQYNDRKIASWKEAKAVDFFYTMPMKGFLGLTDLSPQNLVTFMELQGEILRELILETPEP